MQDPHNLETLAMIFNEPNFIIYGSWCVALISVEAFIQDQGTFIMSTLALILTAKAEAVVYLVATLFASLVDGISTIVIQCDCNNNTNNKNIPKVLFHDFYRL